MEMYAGLYGFFDAPGFESFAQTYISETALGKNH